MYRAKHEINYRDREGNTVRVVANTNLTEEHEAAIGKATIKDLLAKGALVERNDDGSKTTPSTEDKKAKGKAAGKTVKTAEEKQAEKDAAAAKAEADKALGGQASGDAGQSAASGTTVSGSKPGKQ